MRDRTKKQTTAIQAPGRFLKLDFKIISAILVLIVSAVVIIMAYTVHSLSAHIQTQTHNYVSDVSQQIARNIDFHFSNNIRNIGFVAKSLAASSSGDMQQILIRDANAWNFLNLTLWTPEGSPVSSSGEAPREIVSLPAFKAAVGGESGVSVTSGQNIVFTTPVELADGSQYICSGIRSGQYVRQLMDNQSFSGNGVSVITNTDGDLLLTPDNPNATARLIELFENHAVEKTYETENKIRSDAANLTDGVVLMPFDDETLVVSYNALRSYNWVLVTIVNSDLISGEVDRYVVQTIALEIFVAASFILILAVVAYIHTAYKQRVEFFAFADPLTGGMNNIRFILECERLLKNDASSSRAMLSMNIRNFNLLNESFGRQSGDDTLKYIYRTISDCLSPGELAVHANEDHFYLLLKEISRESILARAEDITDRINSFNKNIDTPYYILLSFGAYLIDDNTLSPAEMEERANVARENAEKTTNCGFYSAQTAEKLRREKELNDTMARSLANGEFQVYFQPKVYAADSRPAGAEALVRWISPSKGMIPPSEFIPVFENSGSIRRLDYFVFEETCRLIRKHMDEGKELFPISVNLSRQHFQQDDPIEWFRKTAEKYSIPPNMIEIELTESIFFTNRDIENVQRIIHDMHDAGFLCSLDDFGAGFSSLGLLKDFDIDAIKLDRCFFSSGWSERATDVVGSIIELASKLGIKTVAEGIEDSGQAEFLKTAGCTQIQGFLFARPMPEKEFETWLEEH